MRRRKNPTTRVYWIAGLAAGGAALVGGIAYVATRGSSTSTAATTPPTATLPTIPKVTYPVSAPVAGATAAPTTPYPGTPQSVTVTSNDGVATVQAVAGPLTITLPAGLYYVNVNVSPSSAAAQALTYIPSTLSTGGPSVAGNTVTVPLTGAACTITVSASDAESNPYTFTITVQ